MALVPQVVDAVKVPVIAAGGIADARGVVAAFALGAAAVQIGTAYLLCSEARISSVYRQALRSVIAVALLAPLRSKSEMAGSVDFTPLWSGQAARLSRELPAAELTKRLAAETLERGLPRSASRAWQRSMVLISLPFLSVERLESRQFGWLRIHGIRCK